MKKKGYALSAFALAAAVAVAGCGQKSETSPSAPASGSSPSSSAAAPTVVTMAINNTWKPFGFVNENDELAGYNIDVLKAVDERIPEYEFKFEGMDQAAMFLAVDTGKAALGAGSLFKTPERQEKYLFPDENYGSLVMYLAVKGDRTDINSLEDMAGKKLAPLMPNTSNYNIIVKYNESHPDKQIKIETIDNIAVADALKWVEEGRYDAFLIPGMTFHEAQKDLKLNVKVTDPIQEDPIYFVLNKEQTDLKAKMDAALKAMKEDGTLSQISTTWLGEDLFN